MQSSGMTGVSTLPLTSFLKAGRTGSSLFSRGAAASVFQREKRTGDFTSDRIADGASRMLSSARKLDTGAAGNSFLARAIESSNTNVVSGSAPDGAMNTRFTMTVERTATSRDVVSDAIDFSTPMNLPRTSYSFQIKRDSGTYSFRIDAGQLDTSKDVMNAIAEEINDAGAGLYAEVNINNTARTAQLEIHGLDHDELNSVTIRDTSGDIMKRLGVSATQKATEATGGVQEIEGPAVFTINGKTFHSNSNTVALYDGNFVYSSTRIDPFATPEELYNTWVDNGGSLPEYLASAPGSSSGRYGNLVANIKLNGASGDDITVSVTADTEKIFNSVESFVDDRNNMLNTLQSAFGDPADISPGFALRTSAGATAAPLSSLLEDTVANRSEETSNAGLEQDGDELEISEQRLRDNLSFRLDEIQKLFGNPGGIANKTEFAALKLANFSVLQGTAAARLPIYPSVGFTSSGFVNGPEF